MNEEHHASLVDAVRRAARAEVSLLNRMSKQCDAERYAFLALARASANRFDCDVADVEGRQ